MKYNSDHQRHQMYLGAFNISNIEEYYITIAQFVTDPKLSCDNVDDLDLFISLIFDSKFKNTNTSYLRYFLSNSNKFKFSFEAVSKFLNFLHKDSELFSNDFFNTLMKDYPIEIIEQVFDNLSSNLKLKLLNVVSDYPKILEKSSRMKMYMVFS